MKKGICSFMIAAGLLVSGTLTAQATDAGNHIVEEADSNWQVTFTENGKLEGSFDTAAAGGIVSAMQPGDTAVFRVTLENKGNGDTDWYMKNTIVKSMEENSQAAGGAYSYKLTYIPIQGESSVIYDSGAIGGDNNMGLHEADQALEDYFYLGELGKGSGGEVVLEVGLDGETQGNSYQLQMANLSMNFAVEPRVQGGQSTGSSGRVIRREVVNNEVIYVDENGNQVSEDEMELLNTGGGTGTGTKIVKTGDDTELFPYILAATVSGGLLMLYCMMILKKGKKEEAKEGGRI